MWLNYCVRTAHNQTDALDTMLQLYHIVIFEINVYSAIGISNGL